MGEIRGLVGHRDDDDNEHDHQVVPPRLRPPSSSSSASLSALPSAIPLAPPPMGSCWLDFGLEHYNIELPPLVTGEDEFKAVERAWRMTQDTSSIQPSPWQCFPPAECGRSMAMSVPISLPPSRPTAPSPLPPPVITSTSTSSTTTKPARTIATAPVAVAAAARARTSSASSVKPRRNRSYGHPTVSVDHKRERNRVTFRRFYYRKQQTLQDLRSEEKRLHAHYEQLIGSRSGTDLHLPPRVARYVALVAAKDALRVEGHALTQALQRKAKTGDAVTRLMQAHSYEDQAVTVSDTKRMDAQQRTRFEFLRRTAPVQHQHEQHQHQQQGRAPLQRSECERLLYAAMTRLTTLWLASQPLAMEIRSPSESEAFGWRCRHRALTPASDHVEFQFAKAFTVPHHSIDARLLTERTYAFWTRPRSSCRTEEEQCKSSSTAALPSPMVCVERKVIETMSGSTCVLARTITRGDRRDAIDDHVVAQSVVLVSKRAMSGQRGCFRVVSHSVPDQARFVECFLPDELETTAKTGTKKTTQWVEELCWWKIEEGLTTEGEPSHDVHVTYAGRAPLCLGFTARSILPELLRDVLNWEGEVVGSTACHVPC